MDEYSAFLAPPDGGLIYEMDGYRWRIIAAGEWWRPKTKRQLRERLKHFLFWWSKGYAIISYADSQTPRRRVL